MAVEAASLIGSATPDDQGSGGGVEVDVGLAGVGELESGLAGLDDEAEVRAVSDPQSDVEVLIRDGIVLGAAHQQEPPEDADSVRAVPAGPAAGSCART